MYVIISGCCGLLFVTPLMTSADVTGSRNLSGTRGDYYDDSDFILNGHDPDEDHFKDDFVVNQRRLRERASAAFEEDLAELRRKRRDMQDRIFDVIDLNAEIERARNTLEAADVAFQRHATKFDNESEPEDMSLTQKLDKARKIATMDANAERSKQKVLPLKWVKMQNIEPEPQEQPQPRQTRIHSLIEKELIEDPLDVLALQPMKRRFLKRKKSVSF